MNKIEQEWWASELTRIKAEAGKVDEHIMQNRLALMQRVWAEQEAEKHKNTGPKGVAAPHLPDIIEFFNDEEACAVMHKTEMDRFNSEKKEQLDILFRRFGLKVDDWKGLALALAGENVDEYKTNATPGAKVKRNPIKVLEDVIRYAVLNRVGVNNAAIAVYPDRKDFKAYEEIRKNNRAYWDSRKADYGLR